VIPCPCDRPGAATGTRPNRTWFARTAAQQPALSVSRTALPPHLARQLASKAAMEKRQPNMLSRGRTNKQFGDQSLFVKAAVVG